MSIPVIDGVEQAREIIAGLYAQGEVLAETIADLRAQLRDSEAQAGVMREALQAHRAERADHVKRVDAKFSPTMLMVRASSHSQNWIERIDAALAPDAGRALLERLSVAEATSARMQQQALLLGGEKSDMSALYRALLAERDALKHALALREVAIAGHIEAGRCMDDIDDTRGWERCGTLTDRIFRLDQRALRVEQALEQAKIDCEEQHEDGACTSPCTTCEMISAVLAPKAEPLVRTVPCPQDMPEHFVCTGTCGVHVKADEDGCCVSCGADCRVEPCAPIEPCLSG